MQSLQGRLFRRIRRKGPGSVFVARDFLDLGSRAAIDQTLSRLAARGEIRRIGHGIYDFPKAHPRLGNLTPPLDAIAHAAARSTQSTIQSSGAQAANALGLTTQVPASIVYLTDGNSRRVQVGPYTIHFKRAAPRNLLRPGTAVGALFQALRHLGRDRVDDATIGRLRSRLDPSVRSDFRRLRDDLPIWMRSVADALAEPAVA